MRAAPAATSGYRKATSEQRPVRRLAFDRLPPTVRRALGRSLADQAAPRPLVSEVLGPRPPSARRWAYVAGAALAAELSAWMLGFGDRVNDPLLSPTSLALLHAAAVAVGLFATAYALRLRKQHLGVPYPAGRHVFELDLVEVEGASVVVTPLDTLKHVEARPGEKGPSIALVFTDGHEVVFADQPDADAQAPVVEACIERARKLVFPQDLEHLEKVDPFLELRIGQDWQVAEAEGAKGASAARPAARSRPRSTRALAAVSVLAGALAGGGMLLVGRQHLVDLDDARFQAAMQKAELNGGDSALEEYIATGGRHAAEADAALFELRKDSEHHLKRYVDQGGPRAEIAEERLFDLRVRQRDVDGLAGYVNSGGRFDERADEALFEMAKAQNISGAYSLYLRKGKRHAAEVEGHLLPEATFREAVRSGKVAPLVAFAEQYPHSPRAAEARAKVHAFYEAELRDYVTYNDPPAEARAFVRELLAGAEQRNDASLVIRVTMAEEAAVTDKDDEPAGPSLGLVASRVERELRDWIASSFPRGLVRPVGPALDPDGALPAIEVALTPIQKGTLVSKREGIRFADVRLRIDFRATIPGKADKITWTATTPGLMSFDYKVKASDADALKTDRADFARQVYGRMVDEMALFFSNRLAERL